jgi:hypothetical protein
LCVRVWKLKEQSFACHWPSKMVAKFCLDLGFPNCVWTLHSGCWGQVASSLQQYVSYFNLGML